MAFITAEVKIPELQMSVGCHLYYPTDLPEAVGNQVKGVITLLHGVGNSAADWMRMSAACRYAADNGYVLVAPSAQNSFYHNMAYGQPWYTIITELLPAQLNKIFRIPAGREVNYIAGLSMGGYGAMRIGLSHPERYAAIGSFSGALNLPDMVETIKKYAPEILPAYVPILGESMQVPDEANLLLLAKQAAALPKAQQPRIYASCGAQDNDEGAIRAQNRGFCKAVQGLGLDFTYAEWDGVHEWNFWDRSLAEFIGFIQGSDYADKKRGDWAAAMTVTRPSDI